MKSSNVIQLPTDRDVEAAKASSRTLAKYADIDRVQLTINAGKEENEDLVIPGHALQLLLDILSEMSRGNAISIMPVHAELSTQEAANILNVSRPYIVKLLDGGDIPYHKVGSHRRVCAKDLIDYKNKIDEAREKSLNKLAQESQSLDMGYE